LKESCRSEITGTHHEQAQAAATKREQKEGNTLKFVFGGYVRVRQQIKNSRVVKVIVTSTRTLLLLLLLARSWERHLLASLRKALDKKIHSTAMWTSRNY